MIAPPSILLLCCYSFVSKRLNVKQFFIGKINKMLWVVSSTQKNGFRAIVDDRAKFKNFQGFVWYS